MKSYRERSFIFIASAFFLKIFNKKYCGNAILCEFEYRTHCTRHYKPQLVYFYPPFSVGFMIKSGLY